MYFLVNAVAISCMQDNPNLYHIIMCSKGNCVLGVCDLTQINIPNKLFCMQDLLTYIKPKFMNCGKFLGEMGNIKAKSIMLFTCSSFQNIWSNQICHFWGFNNQTYVYVWENIYIFLKNLDSWRDELTQVFLCVLLFVLAKVGVTTCLCIVFFVLHALESVPLLLKGRSVYIKMKFKKWDIFGVRMNIKAKSTMLFTCSFFQNIWSNQIFHLRL